MMRKVSRTKLYVGFVGGVVVLGAIATVLFFTRTDNLAEEAVRPLLVNLEERGFRRKCFISFDGKGSVDREPHYGVFFESDFNVSKAEELVLSTSRLNGYSLIHADSPYETIEWYSDVTSKIKQHPGLVMGAERLNIEIYSGGEEDLGCSDGTRVKSGADHVAIRVSLSLPRYE